VLDSWVTSLGEQDFLDVLPLLRRTFGGFSGAERANLGAAVRQLATGTSAIATSGDPIDAQRAAAVLQTVATILGGHR
jgi:hypothetical protein